MADKKRIRRSFTDDKGERHYGKGSTIEEAIADRERIKFEIEHGIFTDDTMTVSQLADLYFARLDQNKKIQDKTAKERKSITRNYILNHIGPMKICDVREIHIMYILQMDAAVHTDNHINKVLMCLNAMFRIAKSNRLCAYNPCADIEKPQGKDAGKRREATTLERNTYTGYLVWLDMVILCGLRPGETSEVHFKDIHDGYMWVQGTKNDNAQRYVPVPDALHDRILALPHTFDSEYVCRMRDNKRSRQWIALVSDLALPESDLVPYCFRHSYVTDLENCPGLSQAAIKTIVGHSVKGVTDRYTHSRPETCIEARPLLLDYWKRIGFKYGNFASNEYKRISNE